MNVTSVCVLSAGPACVSGMIMSNSCSEPITEKNTDSRTVGASSGSVIAAESLRGDWRRRSRPRRTARASIPCSPAMNSIMWKPKYFHTITTRIA